MIYVASSWRNEQQPAVVALLRAFGHSVYDFKDADGFHWSEVDPTVEVAGFAEYGTRAKDMAALLHSGPARRGYARDISALKMAHTLVLVLPCGRSAHLELGIAVGLGKRTIVLLDDPCQPELMYRAVDYVLPNIDELARVVAPTSDTSGTSDA